GSGAAAPVAVENAPVSPASRRLEPLSADRFAVRFTADTEFCELLERVRGLTAHRLPSGDLMTLMKRGLEAYERELKKERFAVGRKPLGDWRSLDGAAESKRCKSGQSSSGVAATSPGSLSPGSTPARPSNISRHVPAAVARVVYLRDNGQCTFVSNDGR